MKEALRRPAASGLALDMAAREQRLRVSRPCHLCLLGEGEGARAW